MESVLSEILMSWKKTHNAEIHQLSFQLYKCSKFFFLQTTAIMYFFPLDAMSILMVQIVMKLCFLILGTEVSCQTFKNHISDLNGTL